MLKVAICGGSGYTGAELLRILLRHPKVRVVAVTSERSAGKPVTELYRHLYEYSDLVFEPLKKERLLKKADLFFMALPHGASQEAVDFFFRNGKKVIDLSADFRLKNPMVYEQWYKTPHRYESTLKAAVYGLPEVYRKKISKTSLVANPGCYPTGAILGLYPAIKGKLIDVSSIVIDSKSGTSGAGRKSDVALSFCEVNESFRAYGVTTHRHTPEMEQEISLLSKKPVSVNFTPHLLPVSRGILTTIYARLNCRAELKRLVNIYKRTYSNEPFVRVLDEGKYPDVRNVKGTNLCEIGLAVNKTTNTLIVITAIDNLVKGASGQAVHNMNIMMGFDEATALDVPALLP
jgi:N-acetyl-gamma-glutamyl-phosphate reductase